MKKLMFWTAVLVLIIALVYINLFATPPAGTKYILLEETTEELEDDGNVETYIDSATEEDHHFRLYKVSGWAYQPTGKAGDSREVYLVFDSLADSGKQYSVSCGELMGRSDVAGRTDGITPPQPDTVGFDNVTFSAKDMEEGTYQLYIRVVEDGISASTKTSVVLKRTMGGASINSVE